MSATHNLRLPASELAKLHPFHPQSPAARGDEVVAELAAAAVATRRRRPVHHLSGFARA
jgi:hypothetical protein